MKRKVLFLITSDPRESPRPAEAIRIAAGVGAWKKVEVTVYFGDAALLSLAESTDELQDEECFRRYLPLLGEKGRAVYIEEKSPFRDAIGDPALTVEELGAAGLARLAAVSDSVLRF
jgi:hypothetical protein